VARQEHSQGGKIVDDRNIRAASERPGRRAGVGVSRAAPVYESERGTGEWVDRPVRDEMIPRPDHGQLANDGDEAQKVTAEWALWGKEGGEPGYRVLRHSQGTFSSTDFRALLARYATGTNKSLPQYTVLWIPAEPDDGEGYRGYLAVGIHELADAGPGRSGGRVEFAEGREIEYVRLFCVRYTELAEFGAGYADLVQAVRKQQLGADLTGPIEVALPEIAPRPASFRKLAETVAILLLTTRPVCVLGADAVAAEERLLFFDSVMSLLPYGMRSTLSASTWASANAQGLKFRLFFSHARLDDGGRTTYVAWGQPGEPDFSLAEDQAPALYLGWLRQIGPEAEATLLGETAPIRFNQADIRKMVAHLPKEKPVEVSLKELANSLDQGDPAPVPTVVKRLNRHLGRQAEPAKRHEYRSLITQLGLLTDHSWLHPRTEASVYKVLLRLAFEPPLSYASYCEIEDAIGGPPRGTLRSVMLNLGFADFVAQLLTIKAEPGATGDALRAILAGQGTPAAVPLDTFRRDVAGIRPVHRKAVYGFTMRYLRVYAEDARAELVWRGYLADTLEAAFPADMKAQQIRLEDTLQFVYGGRFGKGQIAELFASPQLSATAAFEAAVGRLASRRARRIIGPQVALARLRKAGLDDDVRILQHGRQRSGRWRRRAPEAVPHVVGTLVPKSTVIIGAVIIGAVVIFIILVWVTGQA
jgi:hypothetical protein